MYITNGKAKLFFLLLILTVIIAGCGQGSNTESSDPGKVDSNKEQDQVSVDFPTGNINGVIQWGAGGSTDTLSRGIAKIVEKHLDASLVMTNQTGATGAIAMQHVFSQPADGQTILFAAENPTLYGVLDISERGFDEFYPINLMGIAVPVIVVPADSEFETIEELFDYITDNPSGLNLGSTGVGGLPHVVSSMLAAEKGLEFNMVPFDGDGPALTALLGGHTDVSIAVLSAAGEYVKSGDVRALAVVNDTMIEDLPGVPALGEVYPEFNQYLPWGPFFGAWVKKDTPEEVIEVLVDAFQKAQQDDEYQELLASLGATSLGIYGDEAEEFWKQWQSTTTWILYDSGAAKISPADLGIPRVGE